MNRLKETTAHFCLSEDGAVTVDWVVLTAALVGLGLAVMAVVSGGTEDLSSDIDGQLVAQEITTEFGAPFEMQQWDANNPGIYDSYAPWMAAFEDQQLLDHYANTAQWAESPPNSGHPYDTYHDEFWIARDEAISRGLISEDDPIPS